MPSIAVTGLSVASCIGNELETLSAAHRARLSGLSRTHRFQELFAHIPLGEVPAAVFADESEFLGVYDCHLMRMVSGSLRKALRATGLLERYSADAIGVFVGSTTGGIERLEHRLHEAFAGRVPWDLSEILDAGTHNGAIKYALRGAFPLRGPMYVLSTACSSGALAIKEACEAVATGLVRAAVAGGFDVLAPMTIAGFDSMQILDHEVCQPLSGLGRGLNLGEGGAWIVLEAAPTPGSVRAWLVGAGASSDAHHMTQPDPEGRGMGAAMGEALANANLQPTAIGYINAHGTGTKMNDTAETAAIKRLFGPDAPFESTKGLHGHTLAGAGALEAATTILALERGVARSPYAISNSFGFGGANVSLVFRRGGDQ